MAYVGGSAQPALTYAQVEALWIQAASQIAGVNQAAAAAAAPMAAAIAMAESGLVPNNWNTTDPAGGSFGLFQINGAHASALQSAGLTNWQTDPLQNAEAAVMVWQNAGGTFTKDWSTAMGAQPSYLAYLPDAQGASGTIAATPAIAGTSSSTPAAASSSSSGGGAAVFTPTALSSQAVALIVVGAAIVLLVALAGALRGAQPSANEAST